MVPTALVYTVTGGQQGATAGGYSAAPSTVFTRVDNTKARCTARLEATHVTEGLRVADVVALGDRDEVEVRVPVEVPVEVPVVDRVGVTEGEAHVRGPVPHTSVPVKLP